MPQSFDNMLYDGLVNMQTTPCQASDVTEAASPVKNDRAESDTASEGVNYVLRINY